MSISKDNRKKYYQSKAECPEEIKELLDIANLPLEEAKDEDDYSLVYYLLSKIAKLSTRFRANKISHTDSSHYWIELYPTEVVYEITFENGEIVETPKRESIQSVSLIVGADGKMNFQLHHAITTLQGQSLERIRRCLVCQKFFWAKKDNAETCEQKCAKTLFNRKRADRKKDAEDAAKEKRDQWKNLNFSEEK